jgi:CubicO group peptidase (beta-lactamase class C family)
MDQEAEIDRIFTDYRGADSPGAVVRVIHDGAPVATRTYGLANVDEKIPVRPETNFRLASVTKQFTGMSILILVDRGALALEDTLRDVFPAFPEYGAGITLRQVLQHSSGLIDYEPFVPEDSDKQIVDREVLDLMMQQDHTYFPPGSAYRYSNSGYALLAMVVEETSGRSFADFLKENIFEPLGMHDTVAHREGVSVVANRAYGYHVGETGVEFSDQSPWSAVLGDGGIYTSVIDLAKWDQALYDNPFVRPELLEEAFTPGFEDYGFGWRIDEYRGHRRMHHEGSTVGFRNFMQRFPEEHLTVIVLSNRREPGVESLGERVADLYLP